MQHAISQAFATLLSTLNLKADLHESVEDPKAEISIYRTDDNKLIFSCTKFEDKELASIMLQKNTDGMGLFAPVKELDVVHGDNSDVIDMPSRMWSRELLLAFPEVKGYTTSSMTCPDETVKCRYLSFTAVTEEDELISMTFLETEQELTREKSDEILRCEAAAALFKKHLNKSSVL